MTGDTGPSSALPVLPRLPVKAPRILTEMKRREQQKCQVGDILTDIKQHEFSDRGGTARGEMSSVKEQKERVGKRRNTGLTRSKTGSPCRPGSKSKI